MGTSFINLQVRSEAEGDVAKALKRIISARAYISNAKGGWVSVYDEACSSHTDDEAVRIAKELSDVLLTAVLVFQVYDSDVLQYWIFEKGALTDEFNSSPDYFGEIKTEARDRVAGKPSLLLGLSADGTDEAALQSAIRWPASTESGVIHEGASNSVFAEDKLRQLASLLGIIPARAVMRFESFLDDEIEPSSGGRRSFKLLKSSGYEKIFRRNQKLIEAVKTGSRSELISLLADGVSPNSVDTSGQSALMIALGKGDTEASRLLIEAGANRHSKFMGGSIIGFALISGSPDALRLVLDLGLDASEVDELGKTPLFKLLYSNGQMFSAERISMLVEAGANPNQACDVQFLVPPRLERGVTPLICAVRSSNVEATRRLLELGAEPAVKDASGKDAMTHAMERLNKLCGILGDEASKATMGESMVRLFTAQASGLELIIELLSPESDK